MPVGCAAVLAASAMHVRKLEKPSSATRPRAQDTPSEAESNGTMPTGTRAEQRARVKKLSSPQARFKLTLTRSLSMTLTDARNMQIAANASTPVSAHAGNAGLICPRDHQKTAPMTKN